MDVELSSVAPLSEEARARAYGEMTTVAPLPEVASNHFLLRENREQYLNLCMPLYKAALNGEWDKAEAILGNQGPVAQLLVTCSITEGYETALHVAAGARQTKFVEKLVTKMRPRYLELQDRNGNTAFCLAAAAGSVPIAEILMGHNDRLPIIRGNGNMTPLYLAATYGHSEMVSNLYEKTINYLGRIERIKLFFICIDTDLYDTALMLIRSYPELAETRANGETALHALARKPLAFARKGPQIWQRIISSYSRSKCNTNLKQTAQALELVSCLWEVVLRKDESEIRDLLRRPWPLLFEAVKQGNYEFLAVLIGSFPDLIWEVDDQNRTIFHAAVLHRQSDIFSQIYKIGGINDFIVTYEVNCGDNILHLAAKVPSQERLNSTPGAALQMQRELLWFKEIEKMMQPSFRKKKGSEDLTPRALFSKEHARLLKDGEAWMKDTAHSCMLVATIIAAGVFAAAFNLPVVGNDQGNPGGAFKENLFQVFAISNAIALSFSLISTLMFLSILISRYAEEDFLRSLPKKLMVGLLTLFISILAMVVDFSTAFFLAYNHKLTWVPILISALGIIPAIAFLWLEFSHLFVVFKSTYHSRHLFHPGKPMIS